MGLFAVFFYFSLSVVNSFNFLAVTGHHWAHFQNEAMHSIVSYASSEKDEYYDQYLKNLKLSALLKSARAGTLKENPNLYIDSAPVVRDPTDFHNLRELSFFLQQYGQQGSLKKVVEKWSDGDNKMAVLSDLAAELREDIKKNEMVAEKREYYKIRLERLKNEFASVEGDFFVALNESHSGFSANLIWLNLIVLSLLIIAGGTVSYLVLRPLLKDLKNIREAAQEIEYGGDANPLHPEIKISDFSFMTDSLVRIKAQLALEIRDRERAQNMAGLGMWKWSANGHKMTWSRKVFEILNLPVGLGPSYEAFRDRVHPEDRAIFDNLLREETYAEMKSLLVELRLVCNYGGRWQIRFCHILVEAQTSEHGPVISGTIQDITERKNNTSKAS
ncbi:MAG: putative signal transduction histidine kinase [Pseudobdellovibrio sp.]|nr:putative signal transduction histidine kinase [Pseudobdellovibrio sp.]